MFGGMAWQTWVVHVVVLFNMLLAFIAGNVQALGITNPWLTLIAIPFAVGAGTYAGNQLKTIGAEKPPVMPEAPPPQ